MTVFKTFVVLIQLLIVNTILKIEESDIFI